MNKLSDEQLLDELQRRFEENKKTVDELNKLNKILTRVNNKLSEAEAMKSHFISNISNEILNPFTSILSLSRTVLDADKESWKKIISMIHLIHGEAFNLDFQFKNIFMAARIEAGEVSLQMSRANIRMLINGITDLFKYETRKNRLTLLHYYKDGLEKEDSYFITDPEKLRLVLSNIVSNAIKFSHAGGEIEIVCSKPGNDLIIEVQDYGKGIGSSDMEIIFDRFRKADSGINSINRGHGLGLAVVKALIEMLCGNVTVKSQPGQGSLFTITVPEWEGEIEGTTLFGSELFFEEG